MLVYQRVTNIDTSTINQLVIVLINQPSYRLVAACLFSQYVICLGTPMIDPPKSDYFSANMMNCLGCTMVASEKNHQVQAVLPKKTSKHQPLGGHDITLFQVGVS